MIESAKKVYLPQSVIILMSVVHIRGLRELAGGTVHRKQDQGRRRQSLR